MIMVFGFPSNSITRILAEMDSMLRIMLTAGDNKKLTPPTEALTEVMDADNVMIW